jgi:hypothetical protein
MNCVFTRTLPLQLLFVAPECVVHKEIIKAQIDCRRRRIDAELSETAVPIVAP